MNITFTKFLLVILISTWFVSPSSFSAAELTKVSGNAYLGDLPIILESHAQKMTKLHDLYKQSKNDEDKEKLEIERDLIQKEFKEKFSEYIKTEPLKNNTLPFKVASKGLPFEVLGVKVDRLSLGTTYFKIQAKINKDIRKPDGKFSQRTYIHFVAVDSEDKVIPHTWNWATTQGFINLEAGVVANAKGHWNANRMQNMKDFSYLKIMSKEDYFKMKKSQKKK